MAVAVAQMVKRLLPTPELRGSNPVIGKLLYIERLFTFNCIEKTKIKKKNQEMAHFVPTRCCSNCIPMLCLQIASLFNKMGRLQPLFLYFRPF